MAEAYDQPLDPALPTDSTIEGGASVRPGTPEAQREARELVERHRRGKARKKRRDLTAEKYMLHVDGEGDGQWAEIRGGSRVEIPPRFGRARISANLLEPIFEDWISYITSEPLRFAVDGPTDRKARDQGRVNTLLANHIAKQQRVNAILAQGMQMAGVYGMCPVHSSWRDDLLSDPYEPIYQHDDPEIASQKPQKGFVDVWVGDPFGTTFNAGSKLGSIQLMGYERLLPAKMVRHAFRHVPGIESLQGSDKVASSSIYQRIGSRWQVGSRWDAHGTAIMEAGEGGEELVLLICEEMEVGVDHEKPEGYYRIVAISGNPNDENLRGGQAILLHEGPLPGGVLSAELFYAGFRQDDVLGKPFFSGGLGDAQVYLNQYLTLAAEWARKHAHPPIVVAGEYSIPDDAAIYDDDVIVELQGDQGSVSLLTPNFGSGGTPFDSHIEYWQDYLFRKGGWQAASRGESDASSPAAKVVALARADDSIRGTVVRSYKQSSANMAKRWHQIAKQYMSVPWLVNVTGEEWSYLADPFIRQEQLSDTAPEYRVVSGFGNSPDAKAEQLTNMAMTKLADGQPMLTADEMWERWPDDSMRPTRTNPRKLKQTRAEALLYTIEKVVEEAKPQMQAIAEQFGGNPPEGWQTKALEVTVAQVRSLIPPRMDDDPQIMADKLSELTQDPDGDPLMAEVASKIQVEYLQRLMLAQQQAQQPQQGGSAGGPGVKQEKGVAGSPTSNAMQSTDSAVRELTNAATAA